MEPFNYPPLPTGKEAIRILTVEPGDFYDDPIVCTLTSVPFRSKPRYLALSYTWGDAFPHNQSLPTNKSMTPVPPEFQYSISWDGKKTYSQHHLYGQAAVEDLCKDLQQNKADPITINGQPFPIHHNLHLCLLHLRSTTSPLSLWVDAVCINQADADERNAQVALMSFIYTRAQAVVAWLGVRGPYQGEKRVDPFKTMALEGTNRAAQSLQKLARGEVLGPSGDHVNSAEVNHAAKSSYWTRLWILQEACLASQLVFVYGPRVWTFNQLSEWQIRTKELHYQDGKAMAQMLDARRARYTDAMKLENLAEKFEGLACSELKDRIYGLVGLANDIRPFFTKDDFRDPVEDHIATLDMGAAVVPAMQRKMGRLRVDYSASFYDIWRDVVKNIYFRVGALVHRCEDKYTWTAEFSNQERRISIVRSAGIIQDILNREVGKELYRSSRVPLKETTEKPCIRALGYVAARVLRIGPSYDELISSSLATYDWLDCWEHGYQLSDDLAQLRQVNEAYIRRVIDYTDEELAHICSIKSYGTIARPAGIRGGLDSTWYDVAYDALWRTGSIGSDPNPRICLCSDVIVALVPAMAAVGDVIVRFWDCSTAALMRRVDDPESYMLIGRADISKRPGGLTWEEPTLPQLMLTDMDSSPTVDISTVLNVDLDFRSLQMLSAPIGPGR